MLRAAEGFDADPRSPLGAHLKQVLDAAADIAHQAAHPVATDAATRDLALEQQGGAIVRAARAVARSPRSPRRRLLSRRSVDFRSGRRRQLRVRSEVATQRERDHPGVQFARGWQQDPSQLVALAVDGGALGAIEEQFAQLQLDERSLLFHDDDGLETPHELVHDLGLERVRHAQLEDPNARCTEFRLADLQ